MTASDRNSAVYTPFGMRPICFLRLANSTKRWTLLFSAYAILAAIDWLDRQATCFLCFILLRRRLSTVQGETNVLSIPERRQ